MTPDSSNISLFRPPCSSYPSSLDIGNGSTLPIVACGHSVLLGPFYLNNVLVAPSIIKNLLFVRQFTTDNYCSIEFDPLGLSLKDISFRNVITRFNSPGPLYTLQLPAPEPPSCALAAAPAAVWHRRLGHLGLEPLSKLVSTSALSCTKGMDVSLCHACQLGRHIRLPFPTSSS
jgi:hypothetical protein